MADGALSRARLNVNYEHIQPNSSAKPNSSLSKRSTLQMRWHRLHLSTPATKPRLDIKMVFDYSAVTVEECKAVLITRRDKAATELVLSCCHVRDLPPSWRPGVPRWPSKYLMAWRPFGRCGMPPRLNCLNRHLRAAGSASAGNAIRRSKGLFLANKRPACNQKPEQHRAPCHGGA